MTIDDNLDSFLRVLVVDDHPTIRRGLRAILTEGGAGHVVGEASNGYEAVPIACNDEWDVIILDVSMPGLSGFDVLSQVKRCRPEQRVVMLSMHATPDYIRTALNGGAAGYLTKETAPDELLAAIQAVMSGQTYLGDDLAKLL
jgi:two-component system, NarL family, invasion response regulator UvrY